jgi:hypothetical protein
VKDCPIRKGFFPTQLNENWFFGLRCLRKMRAEERVWANLEKSHTVHFGLEVMFQIKLLDK